MIVADFRREYQMSPQDMYNMPTLHFLWYLHGLSEESNWQRMNQKKERGGGGRTNRHSRK